MAAKPAATVPSDACTPRANDVGSKVDPLHHPAPCCAQLHTGACGRAAPPPGVRKGEPTVLPTVAVQAALPAPHTLSEMQAADLCRLHLVLVTAGHRPPSSRFSRQRQLELVRTEPDVRFVGVPVARLKTSRHTHSGVTAMATTPTGAAVNRTDRLAGQLGCRWSCGQGWRRSVALPVFRLTCVTHELVVH